MCVYLEHDMVKIHVTHILEATTGGTRRHLLDLIERMDRNRFHISVICSTLRDSRFHDDIQWMRSLGVDVYIIPMQRHISPCSDMRALCQIHSILSVIHPDIVHAHSAKAGALGRLAAKWARIPIIVYTPHAFPFLMGIATSHRIAFAMIERILSYITDALIAVSHSERGIALHERIISEDKVHVIENGIDVHRIHFDADARMQWRERWQVPDEAFVIGCVADFRMQKGHEDLIRCIPVVLEQIETATLVLVGRGERKSHLQQLCADLSIANHVIFETGVRDDWSIYSAFDVYVLPSLWEGLPYTPLEAMACKVPVIVTDVAGNRDVVAPCTDSASGWQRVGLLVPPRNPYALARAIITLWQHDEWRYRLGERGRRLVEKRFNIERMVRQTEHLYEQLHSRMVQR